MFWGKSRKYFLAGAILALGIVLGYLAAKTNRPVASDNSAASGTAPTYLLVTRQMFPNDNEHEPQGYILDFHGFIDQTILLTQGIDDVQPENLALIGGATLQTDEFTWAGIKTRITYVRSKDKLQIQRDLIAESDTTAEEPTESLQHDVLMTLDVPESVSIKFDMSNN